MNKSAKRFVVAVFFVLVTAMTAQAQIGVHIGVDLPVFPRLAVVPGYPVYYAPAVRANYFFYDGLFWVFNVDDGYWYSSSWYNGPWVVVEPVYVPQPVLVIPYRYYRVRPVYWGGWAFDRPPRWDVYWGADWVARRRGWDHWDRGRRWVAAPLPLFERQYERGRYPSPARQVTIYNEHYHYSPQDVHVREHRTTIIERQSRGGEAARGRAAFLEQRNQDRAQRQTNVQENRQTRENLRTQDRSQRQANVQENRQRREPKGYPGMPEVSNMPLPTKLLRQGVRDMVRVCDGRMSGTAYGTVVLHTAPEAAAGRHASVDVVGPRQREENLRAQRQANVQQSRQRQEQDRAQRQANVQENRQRQAQDRSQREANVQANRQRQENLRAENKAQHQANVNRENGRRQENVRPEDKGQRQANVNRPNGQRESRQREQKSAETPG